MRRFVRSLLASTMLSLAATAAQAASPAAHNVILFIPDGLRAALVNPTTAPTFTSVKRGGVWFQNSHSLFPTFTTANAAGMATAHALGDSGDFGNTIYVGLAEQFAGGSVTPFVESDQALGDLDNHFVSTLSGATGNFPAGYLNAETILAAARAAGFNTAAIGKVGPVAIFDHANSALVATQPGGNAADQDTRSNSTIFVDDKTGSTSGIPLSSNFSAALTNTGVATAAPSRGANGGAGNNVTPGTLIPNNIQQDYFAQVATDVALPQFKQSGAPFLMVFWSRDPDGTQHNQGDSLNALTPGINGPTSLAAVTNADNDLDRIIQTLKQLDLADTTDILIAADHGFSTITKNSGPHFTPSTTSFAATQTYQTYRSGALAQEVPTGFLPPGFVAIDLAHALSENLFDPDSAPSTSPQPSAYPPVVPTQPPAANGSQVQRPKSGNGVIGASPSNPDVVVAANGGSDLIYLPNPGTAASLAPTVIATLLDEDYISGIFVDDALGSFPGTLPLSAINLKGSALAPTPAIVINFANYANNGAGCVFTIDTLCTIEVADTGLQQGQGMHGSFSRADTYNFMAAIGPDFKSHLVDPVPVSNADVGATIGAIMGFTLSGKGTLTGRVMSEALVGGTTPSFTRSQLTSAKASNGIVTTLKRQAVEGTIYLDQAGFPGRTVGIH